MSYESNCNYKPTISCGDIYNNTMRCCLTTQNISFLMMVLKKETYIHTYHSRLIPEGVAEATHILPRDTHVLPKLLSYEEYCRRGRL
jgi:hypothetical protein